MKIGKTPQPLVLYLDGFYGIYLLSTKVSRIINADLNYNLLITMSLLDIALKATAISILLNLILPFILTPFASENQIKPPKGAASLSLVGQFMHMMVHHNQVMFMSSVIVGLIVFLSVYFSDKL
tara:strand:- start:454 stop:825 length:372 start_codon:yes stop_codon:yes gene_type:complete